MRVRVLYFGLLREQRGASEESHDLPGAATVADLLRFLAPAQSNPAVDTLWNSLAVAVNREYASASHILCEGDEVALLPPVSGGACAPGKHS